MAGSHAAARLPPSVLKRDHQPAPTLRCGRASTRARRCRRARLAPRRRPTQLDRAGLPGHRASIDPARLLDLLRADADYQATAATRDQHAALTGTDLRDTAGGIWADTAEGREHKETPSRRTEFPPAHARAIREQSSSTTTGRPTGAPPHLGYSHPSGAERAWGLVAGLMLGPPCDARHDRLAEVFCSMG